MTSLKEKLAEHQDKVLIVDDDQMVLTALKLTIERAGYDVIAVKSGQEAIEVMKKTPLSVLICDQRMPGLSGVEVMQQSLEHSPEAVRILLTAFSDRESVINAINVGQVNHYVTKPWEEAQLLRIIENSLEKHRLIRENRVLQELIIQQHNELAKAHENLSYDLKIGAQIHEKMLLSTVPKKIPGVVIDALSLPSKEIDGDFFDFYFKTPESFDLVIGDVMGKGLPAALVGLAVKTELTRFALPTPPSQSFKKGIGWSHDIYSPAEILSLVHQQINPKLVNLEYFVSLFYARFDLRHKILTYVDCGSTKPIHFKTKEKVAVELSGENFPLGIGDNPLYSSLQTQFSEGDVFIFYSDGVTEARTINNELFGSERLLELVNNNYDMQASKLLELIRQAAMNFSEKDKPDDDLTLIVIKIGKNNQIDYAEEATTEFRADLSQIDAVRNFVNRFCRRAPGDVDRLSQEMQLVINEAFCNIIKHGNSDTQEHPIVIKGRLEEGGVIFEILDRGDPFDPSEVNEPSFSGNRDTGYGWHIIRELSDEVLFLRKETLQGWNHLRIYKQFYLGEDNMQFNHKTEGQVLLVTPESESLDARGAPIFREKVIELINTNNLNCVVIDLNKLQFIDSSGLGSFLSVLRLLNSREGDLKLCNMNRTVRTMFELVKMHKIFEIFNTPSDAVRSFTITDHVKN